MFGEKANELIKELKRAEGGAIPLYNEELVRQIVEEMESLFHENQKEVNATVEGERGLHAGVQLRHVSLERNKRCLLAYVYNRLMVAKDLRWECGGVLPQDIKQSLCDSEVQFFNNYSKTLARYMMAVGDGDGLDLTLDFGPPKSLLVPVKCLVEYGTFETSEGQTVLLAKDSQHFLPRMDCERLVRQGILAHTPS